MAYPPPRKNRFAALAGFMNDGTKRGARSLRSYLQQKLDKVSPAERSLRAFLRYLRHRARARARSRRRALSSRVGITHVAAVIPPQRNRRPRPI